MTDFPEIQYQDIQPGDAIRKVTRIDGLCHTTEGVVYQRDPVFGEWVTKEGGTLIEPNSADKTTIYLVSRHTPQLPTKTGSIIVDAINKDGQNLGSLILHQNGDWFNPQTIDQQVSANEIVLFTPGKITEA